MKFSKFHQIIQKILDVKLPAGVSVSREGRRIAKDIDIGRTAFMDKMGVDSELEYKRQCIKNRQIMFHVHIGMNTWKATADALALIHQAAEASGFVIDRAGICLDRRMALPAEHRGKIPAETGPMLETDADWMQVGRVVPIQPHMGDFMIGFPASTQNTINALKAGVTTVGNLSQFFAHQVPMWKNPVATATETVRAISIMGALRERGTLMHSYLEDGFGALFYDCATVAGWALLEGYIVENLLGAKLAHCIGGLTSNPEKRAGWVFALDEIHHHDCIGSMFYGDTISFQADFSHNRALVAEYLCWDIMAQLECPTGHAVLPLPVTEALRVPSAEEIIEIQRFGRRIEATARRLWPQVNFSPAYDFAKNVVSAGKSVFHAALDGLKESGVDTGDPLQLLYVLKELGPAVFEEMFGAGKIDNGYPRGRRPVVPTDVYEMSASYIKEYRHLFDNPKSRSILEGRRILIASADVHEHAVMIIHQLLSEAGADMINLGAEVNPDRVASEAGAKKVEAILISTHNGMALEYARCLKAELTKQNIKTPVVMGGVLNQKVADTALPIDVTARLRELGFYACPRLEAKLGKLLEHDMKEYS